VNPLPKRGDIWLVDFDPTKGDELKKQRPAVVISSDHLGTLAIRLVVPLTTWNPNFKNKIWHIQVLPTQENGLSKLSSADTLQVRSVSTTRFIRQLGTIEKDKLAQIAAGLAVVVEYEQ
jgi:mRNA interferase MazF